LIRAVRDKLTLLRNARRRTDIVGQREVQRCLCVSKPLCLWICRMLTRCLQRRFMPPDATIPCPRRKLSDRRWCCARSAARPRQDQRASSTSSQDVRTPAKVSWRRHRQRDVQTGKQKSLLHNDCNTILRLLTCSENLSICKTERSKLLEMRCSCLNSVLVRLQYLSRVGGLVRRFSRGCMDMMLSLWLSKQSRKSRSWPRKSGVYFNLASLCWYLTLRVTVSYSMIPDQSSTTPKVPPKN
jgi:hypothetical protein